MIHLNAEMLKSVGIFGLPSNVVTVGLAALYSGLEARMGIKLAERMSDEQLDEFETFVDAGDEAGALLWLQENFPDYREQVQEDFATIRSSLERVSRPLRVLLAGA